MTLGRHSYLGTFNSRAQRRASKLQRGGPPPVELHRLLALLAKGDMVKTTIDDPMFDPHVLPTAKGLLGDLPATVRSLIGGACLAELAAAPGAGRGEMLRVAHATWTRVRGIPWNDQGESVEQAMASAELPGGFIVAIHNVLLALQRAGDLRRTLLAQRDELTKQIDALDALDGIAALDGISAVAAADGKRGR